MREFLLNIENHLDPEQVAFVNGGEQEVLLPCRWIRFNDRIKLAFFPEHARPVSALLPGMSLDEVCAAAGRLLDEVQKLEKVQGITLENLVWDMDAIYLMPDGALRLLYLPVAADEAVRSSGIYVKRVYSVIEEMLERVADGETVIRQIEYQEQQDLGNWKQLREALGKRTPEIIEQLCLVGSGAAEGRKYYVGHTTLQIGTDPDRAQMVLPDDSADPLHALIGWNEISFYLTDLGSSTGTFLNDTRLAANTQVPVGPGSEIRIGSCTFVVE